MTDQQGYIRISKVIFGSGRLYWTWVGARDTCVSKKKTKQLFQCWIRVRIIEA